MSTLKTTDSLKDYYIKLQGLYENAVNILTAINQSLVSNASEITVDIADTDDTKTTVRIPSFLYMENKLEQLENNFNNLFELPNSGDAWFTKSQDMIKLKMVRSNTAPLTPVMQLNNVYASITDNNFMNDLVSPKTFLKLDVNNLPDNIESMFMKKIVIYNKSIFDELNNSNIQSYSDMKAALYNYKSNVDYKEYDSVLDLPIKKDTYSSAFKIINIPEINGSTNPWIDETSGNHKHLSYKIEFDTLEYSDEENSAIVFTLKAGDYICLGNEMVVYRVKNVDLTSNTVIIEEIIGHIALQKFEENSEMIMTLYNENYGRWKYVEVPLEENQYICIFLGTIYNNVRSLLSSPYFVDLSTIVMKDAYGNIMTDEYGNNLTYLDYYNKYCVNIGDLIKGLTESAYPQISNYTPVQLNSLQNSEEIKEIVSLSISGENVLQVVPINKHLTNDSTSEEIINLHAQKNDLNAQLDTLKDNINDTYNTMLNTDFSQTTSVSWQSMQSQINKYYTERTSIQKQLNAVIDNINSKSSDLKGVGSEIKYRIRGVTNVTNLEELIHTIANEKCDIVGMDVEYKYKSTSKDTSSITVINSSTFTDWNKLNTIDRQRYLVFDNNINSYKLEYVDYAKTDNIIKWNQIDIPIRSGEDVIIRVRYKLNVGQPFVNIYTPWSDEFTVIFPNEYEEDIELRSIIDTNNNDSINAAFTNTLINDGYQEHIQNKIAASDNIFFHQPDNIYSGFTTSENNLISLKDKLYSMNQDIERYKSLIDSETKYKLAVYLSFDDQTIELSPNTINKINIYNTDHITDTFIKKEMNLTFKNVGEARVNLYSIFPGNTAIPLLLTDIQFYNEYIINYERVPLLVNNLLYPQYLGQWIYFRQNNPYTGQNIYYDSDSQRSKDLNIIKIPSSESDIVINRTLKYVSSKDDYINVDNSQVLLGYRRRGVTTADYLYSSNILTTMETLSNLAIVNNKINENSDDLTINNSNNAAINALKTQINTDNNTNKISHVLNTYSNAKFTDKQLDILQKKITTYLSDKVASETETDKNKAIIDFINNESNKQTILDEYNKIQNELNKELYVQRKEELVDYLTYLSTKRPSIIYPTYYKNSYYSDLSKANPRWFIYDNSIYYDNNFYANTNDLTKGKENKYLLRYEDIQGQKQSGETITLDSSTSIRNFINSLSNLDSSSSGKLEGFDSESSFSGAFLYPHLNHINTVLTEGGENDAISLDVAESITIPIEFEYFLTKTGSNNETDETKTLKSKNSKITKSLYFDIRNSLVRNPLHYMIEITGNYDFSSSGDVYNNFSGVELLDSVTTE